MNLARFRALMRTVTGQARRSVRRLLRAHGVPVTPAQRVAFAKALHPHVVRARTQAHKAGTESLAAQARAAQVAVPPAPLRPYPVAALVTVLENVTRVDDPGPRSTARVTVAADVEDGARPRSRVTVDPPTAQAQTGQAQTGRTEAAGEPAEAGASEGRARVTVDDAPRNPGAGRAKVSVQLLDPTTRRQRRVTVEVTEDNRRDPAVVKVVGDKLEATVERHVRTAGREAVTDAIARLDAARERAKAAAAERNKDAIAARESGTTAGAVSVAAREPDPPGQAEPREPAGKKIGWARILTGDENCAFCAMLASRGPVYESKHTAMFVGATTNSYHDHCDCDVVLVVEGRDWVGREQYDALEQLWMESTTGTSGGESIKSFARAWNGKVADGEVERYLVRASDQTSVAAAASDDRSDEQVVEPTELEVESGSDGPRGPIGPGATLGDAGEPDERWPAIPNLDYPHYTNVDESGNAYTTVFRDAGFPVGDAPERLPDLGKMPGHVLYGWQDRDQFHNLNDRRGHLWGTEVEGKSWFPEGSTEQQIVDVVRDTIEDPDRCQAIGTVRRVAKKHNGDWIVATWTVLDGEPDQLFAYPTHGPNIYKWKDGEKVQWDVERPRRLHKYKEVDRGTS